MARSRSFWQGQSYSISGQFSKMAGGTLAQAVAPPYTGLNSTGDRPESNPLSFPQNFPKWCTDICVIISFKSCLLIHIFSLSKKFKTQAIGSYTEKIKYLKRRNQIQKTKQIPHLHFTVMASWHYLYTIYILPSPGKAFQAVAVFIACICMCRTGLLSCWHIAINHVMFRVLLHLINLIMVNGIVTGILVLAGKKILDDVTIQFQ